MSEPTTKAPSLASQGHLCIILIISTQGCSDSVSINDVMFGEMWLCTGQSNMWLTNWYVVQEIRSSC